MIKKLICIFLFACFSFANDSIEIDQIIEQINKAPLNERYIEMNKLKRILKTKNTQFRQEVLLKLQTSISQKSIKDDNHIDVKDSSIEVDKDLNLDKDVKADKDKSIDKGSKIDKDIRIERDLKIDNYIKIDNDSKHPPKPDINDIDLKPKNPDAHKRNSISIRDNL
jgi:hypothetical protein